MKNNFFWIIPFISFWCGYQLLSLFLNTNEIETPCVVGKSVSDVLPILSNAQLNLRILQQKEEPDMPEGIILNQKPAPLEKMRPNSSLFLVISKKPAAAIAPNMHGKKEKEIQEILRQKNLTCKFFYISSDLPKETCIGQLPPAGFQVNDCKLTIYISSGNEQPILFPNLQGMCVEDVLQFFNQHGIKSVHIIHSKTISSDHKCINCRVVEQKPLAGSLINLNYPPAVYLRVN